MKVRVFANLREVIGADSAEVEVIETGRSVINILEEMVERFPGLDEEIFTEERTLKQFVHVFINGHNVIHKEGLETIVKPNDQFALFPPVAGG